jgi:aerotaxis receptor
MSMIAVLRSMMGLSNEVREEVRREINFYEAVEAHLAWKLRLSDFLHGRMQEKLDPQIVCKDDCCTLGKWIHGSGAKRFGTIPLFQELKGEHARFHVQAAKVVEAHLAGNTMQASDILAGDFARQSRKTVDCLTKLHMQVSGKDAD